MKAKNLSNQAPTKRTKLIDKLPLDTPFVAQVFPIYACNFKCNYCVFQIDKSKRGFISDKVSMSLDLHNKFIDDLTMFPNKSKVLRYVGIGEPLLHKNIVDMIEYANSKNIANRIEILTNASLLTPKMSDSLISAGLDRLVISVQGISKKKYKEICGKDINFENFVDNLKYFYNNKKDAESYIKIVDTALDNKKDEKRFYEIFGDICDSIAIEHTVPIHKGIDYKDIIKDSSVTQFGLPISEVQICPQPFFTIQINPDGNIVPCYSFEYPKIMGNCNNQSLYDIWNGKEFKNFRINILNGNLCKICEDCSIIKHRMFPEDDLSKDIIKLKKIYGGYYYCK